MKKKKKQLITSHAYTENPEAIKGLCYICLKDKSRHGKRKESFVGYTEHDWTMSWNNEFEPIPGRSYKMHSTWHDLEITTITKQLKAYTMRKKPVKVRVTVEEL